MLTSCYSDKRPYHYHRMEMAQLSPTMGGGYHFFLYPAVPILQLYKILKISGMTFPFGDKKD